MTNIVKVLVYFRAPVIKKIVEIFKQSLSESNYDYTSGSIKKAMVLLAIPMILELLLESVFAVVDMYFVAKLPNASSAIAAVGLTEAVVSIVYTIGIGLSIGATAIVARRVGEKNLQEASVAAAQIITLTFFISILLSILGIVFAPNILRMMDAQTQVVYLGTSYAQIMLGGNLVILFIFLINGIFRGAGNAAIAMKSLWLASALNIVLCPVLVFGAGFFDGYGLKGAAMATTIGRGIGVLYQLYFLLIKPRKNETATLRLFKAYFVPNWESIKAIFSVSWAAILQFFIQSGSWIFIAKMVSNAGGTDMSAGYQIAIRNVVFFILPAWGISNAAATLVGQNLGAGNAQRAVKSVWLCTWFNTAFMGLVTILFLFLPKYIVALFVENGVVAGHAIASLQILGSGYLFYGISMVMVQALNGAGDTKTPTYINFFVFWILQIPLAYVLSQHTAWKAYGAIAAVPIAEVVLAIVAYYYFKKGNWKYMKV